MNKYDPQDFAANPIKYQLFKTARIARSVFTCDGEADLPEGAHVGVSYFATRLNKLYRRDEPVFAITHNGAFWGHLYANCLSDFVI